MPALASYPNHVGEGVADNMRLQSTVPPPHRMPWRGSTGWCAIQDTRVTGRDKIKQEQRRVHVSKGDDCSPRWLYPNMQVVEEARRNS